MSRFAPLWLGLWAFACSPTVGAQTRQLTPTSAAPQELEITIRKEGVRRMAVAVPELLPTGTAALTSAVAGSFTATLRADVEYSDVFVLADPALYPAGLRDPSAPEAAERWLSGGAWPAITW